MSDTRNAQPDSRASALPGIPETELVRRAAHGDEAAFEAIMRRNNQLLFHTARGIVHSDVEAQEVMEEAYMAAWKSLGDFHASSGLSLWLARITADEAFARIGRRHAGMASIDLDGDSTGCADARTDDEPDDRAEQASLSDALRAQLENGIDQLPAQLRAVFMLRSVHGLGAPEVAQALGIPEETARIWHARARRALRDILSKEGAHPKDVFRFTSAHCDRAVASALGRFRSAGAG